MVRRSSLYVPNATAMFREKPELAAPTPLLPYTKYAARQLEKMFPRASTRTAIHLTQLRVRISVENIHTDSSPSSAALHDCSYRLSASI